MSGTSNNNASYSTGGVRISRLVKWNQRWGIVIPRLLWYWACYMFAYQINARFKLLLILLDLLAVAVAVCLCLCGRQWK
eukprot:scaffold44142_cov131-Skeletonema_marinoi.AAC.1